MTQWTSWCIVAMTMLVVLALLIAVCVVLTKVVGWLFRNATIFGDSPAVRLIGLGIVAGCSTHTVLMCFRVPIDTVVAILRLLFYVMSKAAAAMTPPDASAPKLAAQLVDQISRGMREVVETFLQLPFARVLRALAWWAVVGQAITLLTKRPPAETQPSAGETNWLNAILAQAGKVPTPTWQNLALVLLLAFGSYLSVSAIVMVPWLRESGLSDAVNLERFDQRLTQAGGSFDVDFATLDKRVEENTPFIDLDALTQSIKSVASADAASTTRPTTAAAPTAAPSSAIKLKPSEAQQLAAELDVLLADAKKAKHDTDQRLRDALKTSIGKRGELRDQARGAYEASIRDPMSASDRSAYFELVIDWYRNNVGTANSYARYLSSDLEVSASDWRRWSDDVVRAGNNLIAQLNRAPDAQRSSILSSDSILERQRFRPPVTFASQYSVSSSAFSRPPDRPKAGVSWGVFGKISSWLLETKSQALALITGMIGFGILGSAVSTFVREKTAGMTGGPLVQDVTGVAIRGVSAAIVVYLAVVGGLSVFATDVEKPNAYALFLTCLVGSVFSDKIWIWAQDYLGNLLPASGKDKKDALGLTDRSAGGVPQ